MADRPRIELGKRLRQLRARAGLSGPALAAKLRTNQSKVSRTETGRTAAPLPFVRQWLAAVDATADERAEVLELAERALTDVTGYRQMLRGSMATRQRELLLLQRGADRIRHFQPAMIPGHVQPETYARAVLLASRLGDEGDLEEAVEARLQRGREVLESGAPTYEMILTEQALRWRPPTITPADRTEAWKSLRRFGTAAHVTVRIIPADVPTEHAPVCPFVMVEAQGDDHPMVYVELPNVEITFADPDDVAPYERAWERLRQAALSPRESAALLGRMIREA